MDKEELKPTLRSPRHPANLKRSTGATSASSSDINIPLRRRIAINFTVVWLDPAIDESDVSFHHEIAQLGCVFNTPLKTFSDIDECIRFLTQAADEKIVMIVTGFVGKYVVPVIHDMAQVDSVYVVCANISRHESWTKNWSKVKGAFTEINSIGNEVEQLARDQNSISARSLPVSDEHYLSFGFLAFDEDVTNENLDELDPSFMLTKVLKEILLELKYDDRSMNELAAFCREQYWENKTELSIIDEFERDYHPDRAIWWYTRESFTYNMLNRSLRTMEVDRIIKMGFFLRDLHQHVARIHAEQYSGLDGPTSFTVYRGQGVTRTDFIQLKKTKGGLISFNNFLSTSTIRNIALSFTRNASTNTEYVGILFVMVIDPSISSTPFATIRNVSYFEGEEEILFSMHSVFRISSIKQMDANNDRMWQVDLTLTGDDDPQLHILTERLREETRGSLGWDRLGKLLIKLGMFDNAHQTYTVLLDRTTDDTEKAHFYHQLGYIKEDMGQYDDALSFYENSLDIKQKAPPSDKSHFAMYYNNVGSVYDKKGEYLTAVSFFKKSIEIYERIFPLSHPCLATCYNNIGSTNRNLKEYSTALMFYEKALAIDQKTLPPNDPLLAISYNNMGLVYDDMQEYETALSYYEKTLDIYRKALSPDHPDFSIAYSNKGSVYSSMGEYAEALSHYNKALEIDNKTLPSNHPSLGISHNNIGSLYKNMEDYSSALASFQRAFNIEKSSQSPNDSRLQLYTRNIEFTKEKLS